MSFQLGDILLLDGDPCVVVGLSGQVLGEVEVPEEHLAVWFGENGDVEHKQTESRIVVRTVPTDYFTWAPAPTVRH